VWKRMEEEKDMPNHLLYNVRTPSPPVFTLCAAVARLTCLFDVCV